MVQYYTICGRAQERASKGRGPSVARSPIGWRIAVGGRDGNVETYDCRLCAGRELLLTLAEKRLAEVEPKTK